MVLYVKTFSHLWQHLAKFFLEWEIFETKVCRENQNTFFMFNNFFRELHWVWDNVKKYGGASGATNDITMWQVHTSCLLDKQGYMHTCAHTCLCDQAPTHTHACTHTQRQICNTCCFYMATVICEHTSMLCYTYIVWLVVFSWNILDTCCSLLYDTTKKTQDEFIVILTAEQKQLK
jgi:hypothetical protein